MTETWPSSAGNYAQLIEAVEGQNVKIWVQVWSRGRTFDPAPGAKVRVQVWVWHSIAGSAANVSQAIFSVAPSVTRIVGASGPNSRGTPGVAVVDWTPTVQDPSWVDPQTGKVHYCIVANAYWDGPPPSDGAEISSGWVDICNNRRHGQKNINVRVMWDEEIEIPIQIGNHKGEGEQEIYRVEVREVTGARVLTRGVKVALLAQDFVDLAGGQRIRPRTIKAQPQDLEEGIVPEEIIPLESIEQARVRGGGRLVLADDPRVELRVPRRPAEEVYLKGRRGSGRRIKVAASARTPAKIALLVAPNRGEHPGATRVFDVVQRASGERVLGGFRAVRVYRP